MPRSDRKCWESVFLSVQRLHGQNLLGAPVLVLWSQVEALQLPERSLDGKEKSQFYAVAALSVVCSASGAPIGRLLFPNVGSSSSVDRRRTSNVIACSSERADLKHLPSKYQEMYSESQSCSGFQGW